MQMGMTIRDRSALKRTIENTRPYRGADFRSFLEHFYKVGYSENRALTFLKETSWGLRSRRIHFTVKVS